MKMKTIPISIETFSDSETGLSVTKKIGNAHLMPPRAGVCAICGHDHPVALPHNAQSLYYQYAFYGEHGRWPTWADACAHVSPIVAAEWQKILRDQGHWTAPPDGVEPIAQQYEIQK